MVSFDRLRMSSYWHPILTMALSCIIYDIKQDTGQKSKFLRTSAFSASVRGSLGIFPKDFRLRWLSDGKENLRIRLLILTQFTNVTGRRTDTPQRHRLHLCIASHGRNFIQI